MGGRVIALQAALLYNYGSSLMKISSLQEMALPPMANLEPLQRPGMRLPQL
jgi:hypothetical protein